jgi:integrase
MVTKVGLYKDRRNKSRPWVVRWFGEYDPAKGKQRHYSKAFAAKREAEAYRTQKQDELNRGANKDQVKDITVREFITRFLESKTLHRRPSTRYSYQLTLTQLVDFVGEKTPLAMISPEVADTFIASRQRIAENGSGYSSWSRNRHLANSKTTFSSAVRWGYLTENPFIHITPERCSPRKWHHIKPEELHAVLQVTNDSRWQVFYLLAYTTGARFGELFNLTWRDIDFDKGTVTIQDRPATANMPSFFVKDHEARTLLLAHQTVEALLAWQMEAPEAVPYVLLTASRWKQIRKKWQCCRSRRPWKRNGKTAELEWADWENRFMVNNVLRDMRSHFRRAGVEVEVPVTIHTLRKSFGQNHATAGTPMHVLQRLMGHASITTTREFYLKTADANEREALARYESILDAEPGKTCVRIAYEQNCCPPSESPVAVTTCQEVS